MHRSQTRPAVLLVLSLLLAATGTRAGNAETRAKLKAALANFQAVTPEILQDPKNADLLQELRLMAKNRDSTATRVPLIKSGDEEVIRSCVEQLDSDDRNSAVAQLGLAANPKTIPFLAGHLNKNENATKIRVGDDLWILPVSMNAALVTKRIILKTNAFSPAVQEWAKKLPEISPGLRVSIRAWWETNKAALLREDYAAVKVP